MGQRRRRIGFSLDDDDDEEPAPRRAPPTRMQLAAAVVVAVVGGFAAMAFVSLGPVTPSASDSAAERHGHAAAAAAVQNVFAPLAAFESCRASGGPCATETRWVIDQAAMARADLSATAVDAAEEDEKARSLAALSDVGDAYWDSRMCEMVVELQLLETPPPTTTGCQIDSSRTRGRITRLAASLEYWRT